MASLTFRASSGTHSMNGDVLLKVANNKSSTNGLSPCAARVDRIPKRGSAFSRETSSGGEIWKADPQSGSEDAIE
jgi:hypothetical protein